MTGGPPSRSAWQLVSEDGREYYAVFADGTDAAMQDEWLHANVVTLPVTLVGRKGQLCRITGGEHLFGSCGIPWCGDAYPFGDVGSPVAAGVPTFVKLVRISASVVDLG
jgi:hypothetical protein